MTSPRVRRAIPCALLLAIGLAGCNTATPPSAAVQPAAAPASPRASLVSDPAFRLPEGAGCTGAIERFQALIDNDLRTGHTTQSVRDAITADLGEIGRTCAARQDAEAQAAVVALRQENGYPLR
jgi:hypothetical protein